MPLTLILHDSDVTRLHTQSPRLLCLLWPSTCAQIRCTLRYLVNFIRVTFIDVIYTIVTQKTRSCNVYLKLGKPNSLFYIILFSQSIVLYFSSYFTLCKRVSGLQIPNFLPTLNGRISLSLRLSNYPSRSCYRPRPKKAYKRKKRISSPHRLNVFLRWKEQEKRDKRGSQEITTDVGHTGEGGGEGCRGGGSW